MVAEVQAYGYVFSPPEDADDGSVLSPRQEGWANSRDPGWAALKMLRVYAKEDADRSLGVSERAILDQRPNRIKQVIDKKLKFFNSFEFIVLLGGRINATRSQKARSCFGCIL